MLCTGRKDVVYASVENQQYLLNRLFAFVVATNLDFYLPTVNKEEMLK